MRGNRQRFQWPDGKECAVVFSFDLDAEAAMLSLDPENARRLTVLSAGAYGPRVGAPRILELLRQLGVRATFFAPGYDAENHPETIEAIVKDGHEIGHHGYLHKRVDTLPLEEEIDELVKGIEAIQKLTGQRPVGYRAPWWELNPRSPELLLTHGFLYDSSLMGDDVPYLVPAGNGSIVELPVSFLLDDWEQFGYLTVPPAGHVIEETGKVKRLWLEEFDALADEGGLFTLTVHPWLSGRASRIRLLEGIMTHILKSGRAWIVTAREIATHAIRVLSPRRDNG